jgi:hypothetical protein
MEGNMATFVAHEPCPRCGSRDNLGRYSDGSAWCFGCAKLIERADRVDFSQYTKKEVQINDELQLPDDLVFDYPGHVVAWLARYHLSVAEGIKHGWKYSPKWDQLVFIFKDSEGKVACIQARNFNKERAARQKYYNQGSPKDVLPIFRRQLLGDDGGTFPKRLVVVEDAVSAARITAAGPLEGPGATRGSGTCLDASWWHAMPCLGSYLPLKKIVALKSLKYEQLLVWLDSDKLKEAREIEQRAKWIGLSARTIYTEKDPKEYTDDEIREILLAGAGQT